MNVYALGYDLPENLVTCLLIDDLQNFAKMDKDVQFYGSQNEMDPFLPVETELCVGKIDGVWYRCIFVQLLGTSKKAIVYCFDYGIISSIDVDDIRVNYREKNLL